MQPVGAGVPLRVDIAEKTFRSAQGVSVTALQDLSFEVRQGEFACLLGPSGCGKTTTLRILLGLDKDFSGSFQLPEGGTRPHRRGVPGADACCRGGRSSRMSGWRCREA